MDRSALRTYGTQQVMTSSPVKLVSLLYDKAIVSLREAVEAIESGDVQARWKANNKATEILTHLCTTLDHESGGDIARNLHQLYQVRLGRLFAVAMQTDAAAAREVLGLLEPLRDSWRELAEQTHDSSQTAMPQSRPALDKTAQKETPCADHPQPSEPLDLSA